MNLHIDKDSELTAYEQLREQIIFLISTGEIQIGEEMPSVRGLARQLGVSPNTVSKVYSGLARGGWLFEHPGAHHIVVERRRAKVSLPSVSLDDLIDHTIALALGNGYSLQQLADHLRTRLLEQSPDHLLIVEPDPGIGEIMQHEIQSKTANRAIRCSLTELQRNPALRVGAHLVAPVYLVERLGQITGNRTRIIGVSYSPLDSLVAAISRLSKPSLIGWVSVSGAGLKTVSGMAAPAISSRHSSHLFLLDRPNPDDRTQFKLRRFTVEDYRPVDILKTAEQARTPAAAFGEPKNTQTKESAPVSDLRCMDLLFLDSVAFGLIEHPHAIRYQLLSGTSLERIEAAVKEFRAKGDMP